MQVLKKDLAATMAYLVGMRDDLLETHYGGECGELLYRLHEHTGATTIRCLCAIRTIMLQKYSRIDSLLRYDMRNLDRIEMFNQNDIKWLANHNVPLIQVNITLDKYLIRINKLIAENINSCKELFPDWVAWGYIKEMFIMPGSLGNNEAAVIKKIKYERINYTHNIPLYPFQMYINWTPGEHGNLFSTDRKFLTVLYKLHGEVFYDGNKVMDADDETKDTIYRFINDNESTDIIVDCENSDVYKLYSVLKNLDPEEIMKIKKIILYDDYHTTKAWKLLERLVKIEVKHINVDRVTDAKSLVDIRMTAGVCKEFYENNVKSFILLSSDSDFWGLISSLPLADFLVMIEDEKCGANIKKILTENKIYYCSIDDFCKGNVDHIKNLALKTELNEKLKEFNDNGVWSGTLDVEEYVDSIFRACRIRPSAAEKRNFMDRYINELCLKRVDGRFRIELK